MELPFEIEDPQLKKALDFHGHLCPGLLIGYRAARLGLSMLEAARSEDEELVAIVENDSCSADAVQVLTGCTFGKGNLIFRDWGKQVFTLALRPHGRGVRLAFIGDRLRTQKPDGTTDREAYIRSLLQARDEELFSIRPAPRGVDLPHTARIYPTVKCDLCGEGVMAPRAVEIGGRRICPSCLLIQDPGVSLDQTADFFFEVGMLKKTPRSGYQFLGNGSESVAEHSFRTAVIGFVLAKLTPGVEVDKVLKMCLFHDLAEARTGDQNYVNKRYVTVDEAGAVRDACANAPSGNEIAALVTEFSAGETLESRAAHDADQLEMIVELKEKKDLGNKYAADWLYYAEKRLKTEQARRLSQAVLNTDWTHWWFHKEEHLWVDD